MAEGIQLTGLPPQQVSPESKPVAQTQMQPAQESKAIAESVQISVEELQATIEQLNEFMHQGQRSLAFSVDDTAGEVVIQVRDRDTEELIRQIPSPEALELKKHLDGVIGLLFNQKA